MSDKTNPSHYDGANGARLIDITSQCCFASGNAIKYIFRAGKKDGESRMDDLLKAKWYLDRMIDWESDK
jgi:hypothetical protein